jgi:hypothetical protein
MIRRIGDRRATSLDAVIGCARFGMIRGEITNIGDGGLYVCAETRIVPIGANVSVTFNPNAAIYYQPLTVHGRVVHQSLQGFGITFDHLAPACRDVLARCLPQMPAIPEYACPVLRAL